MSIFLVLIILTNLKAQKNKIFEVKSPEQDVIIRVEVGEHIQWSVSKLSQVIIAPSDISLQLGDGTILGHRSKITGVRIENSNDSLTPVNYIRARIHDQYQLLTLDCKGGFGVQFRAYNDAVAYRFVTKRNGGLIIKNEEANFNFNGDPKAFIPIERDYRGGRHFNSSFEALYHEINLSQFPKDSLAFLPVLVDVGLGRKVVILEADLEDYPGMYLHTDSGRSGVPRNGLKGVYAPFPLETENGGFDNINLIPTKRADYIAKTLGTRTFPWRVIAISDEDKELLNNDIVQKLAAHPRLSDLSWIQPGQVAWDWWNNLNISHVDFKAGLNTRTYQYYIDFASANKIKYIIVDGGWSKLLDLFAVVPDLNLKKIIDYGTEKSVGVILWASWNAVLQQMDSAFPFYAKLGAKGFKIDFIDRDDQVAVASLYNIAEKASENKLMVDYHGVYKPTGLQRTYPNVMGFEGVKGLENYKWADEDQPRYIVTIPFVRMLSGPMDYTPGAMRNSSESNYRIIPNNPMSKGTRCQQLAMYVVFHAPWQMLSDNPTTYRKEQECTDFITKIPVIYDQTIPMDGKLGEYLAIARKKDAVWYIGAMTNWTARNLKLDFSFLEPGDYQAEIFRDGINADSDGTDYKKETIKISSGEQLMVHLAPGGGWVARLTK